MQRTKAQKRLEAKLIEKGYQAALYKVARRRDLMLIISIAEFIVIGFLVYLLVKG